MVSYSGPPAKLLKLRSASSVAADLIPIELNAFSFPKGIICQNNLKVAMEKLAGKYEGTMGKSLIKDGIVQDYKPPLYKDLTKWQGKPVHWDVLRKMVGSWAVYRFGMLKADQHSETVYDYLGKIIKDLEKQMVTSLHEFFTAILRFGKLPLNF